jgi:hypothetical protein
LHCSVILETEWNISALRWSNKMVVSNYQIRLETSTVNECYKILPGDQLRQC